jgi:hypothetical protein
VLDYVEICSRRGRRDYLSESARNSTALPGANLNSGVRVGRNVFWRRSKSYEVRDGENKNRNQRTQLKKTWTER